MTFPNAARCFALSLPLLCLTVFAPGCLQAEIVDRRPSVQGAEDVLGDDTDCLEGCDPADPTPDPEPADPTPDPEGPVPVDATGDGLAAPGSAGTTLAVPWGAIEGVSNSGDPAVDTLLIVFGNVTGPTCQEPFGSAHPCEGWEVSFLLPRELQVVGQVVALNDPRLRSGYTEMGVADEGGSCPGGGGSLEEGTIEVLALDDKQIRIRAKGLGILASFTDPEINGDYEIPLCASP